MMRTYREILAIKDPATRDAEMLYAFDPYGAQAAAYDAGMMGDPVEALRQDFDPVASLAFWREYLEDACDVGDPEELPAIRAHVAMLERGL